MVLRSKARRHWWNAVCVWLTAMLISQVSGGLRGNMHNDVLPAAHVTTPFDLATRFLVASSGAAAASSMSAIGDDPVVTDAGELFSMECAVAFASLPEGKYTPISKLKGFCSTTDQPVKCKQVVVEGLEQANKAGNRIGGEMAWSNWCTSVWEWFAETYGQHCLSQCTKTQCRSTCEWMSKRKKLDEQDLALYDLEEQLKDNQRQLASDKEDLRRKKEKVQYEEGRKQSLQRKMKYAVEKAQNEEWALNNATAAEETAKLKVQEMRSMISNLTRSFEAASMKLEKANHNQEMAEEKASQLQDEVSKEQDLVDDTTSELAALDEKQKAKLKDVSALEIMIKEDTEKIASMKIEVGEEETTYAAKEQALAEQEKALAAEVAEKGKSEMLDIKGQYLQEERQKLKDFKSKVEEKKFEMEKLEQSISLAQDKISKLKERANASYKGKSAALQEVIQKATSEVTALNTKLTAANATLAAASGDAAAALTEFEEAEKKHLVAEKTLPLLSDDLKEKQAKSAEVLQDERAAENDKRKAGMALSGAVQKTEDAIVEMNMTWASVNETSAKLNATSFDLAKKRKVMNSRQHNHSKVQPFIVRHHDLAPPRP